MRFLSSFGRKQRRKAERSSGGASPEALRAYVAAERMAQRLFTKDDLLDFIAEQQKAGKLFDLETVVELMNANTRQAIQIVYTALMEEHVAGAGRILRDVDPVVIQMFKDLERMAVEDGQEVANDKMQERYQLAKARTFRRLKSKGGSEG